MAPASAAVIPAAFAYARADSVDEAVALLAEHGDDAKLLAGGHSLLPLMKLRLATPSVLVDVGRLDELLVRARRRRRRRPSVGSPATTTWSTTRCCASTRRCSRPRPARWAIRRCATAARSAVARARRSRVRPARGRARAPRQHRRAGERRRAHDRGRRLLPRLPRDRAGSRRGHHRGARAQDRAARAGRSRSSTGAAQDWAIVGVAAVGGDAAGRGAGQHGRHAGAGDARSKRRCRAARRRLTPRPSPATAPSRRPI